MRAEMLLLVISVAISSVSQLLLKISANRNSAGEARRLEPAGDANDACHVKSTSNASEADGAYFTSGVNKPGVSDVCINKPTLSQRFRTQYLNSWVVSGYAMLLISMVIPLYVLQFINMKYVAIFESLGYVFIMILSAIILRERVTRRLIIGNILIIAGVVVFGSHIPS
jgi:multidrug transporter EmrE-like cation transporter